MITCTSGDCFPGHAVVKNPPASAGDTRDVGLIPGLGRSPGEGNGNPLQYSFLENSMDRGVWRATIHRVAKSQTQLNDGVHTHTHTHTRDCPKVSMIRCLKYFAHRGCLRRVNIVIFLLLVLILAVGLRLFQGILMDAEVS